ncbi:phage tail protein [Tropicibacter sp. R15_0]|uniref:phage tail-collar fiber domain-containing protein n=1 Tax=Tropicibacter sp. R15_0 TaxID=2821101 RepID=UPI001ADCD185|nr:phage tail protein [Tropicibacter sp. R15_0]MBO9465486.1 phage tail protein [Tropicibacter sp. R15_0]
MSHFIQPVITDAGLNAILSASSQGLEGNITHMAFGDGGGAGYEPGTGADGLRNERLRVAVGGGERTGPATITVQGHLQASPEFWVREVSFVLDDGTHLAIWSDEATPLMFKTAAGEVVVAFTLALSGLPDNSVNVVATGPDVNVIFDREFALVIANQAKITRQQFHLVEEFRKEHGRYPGA